MANWEMLEELERLEKEYEESAMKTDTDLHTLRYDFEPYYCFENRR